MTTSEHSEKANTVSVLEESRAAVFEIFEKRLRLTPVEKGKTTLNLAKLIPAICMEFARIVVDPAQPATSSEINKIQKKVNRIKSLASEVLNSPARLEIPFATRIYLVETSNLLTNEFTHRLSVGARKLSAPERIGKLAAVAYFNLVGKKPGRGEGSPFVYFLEGIFEALKIDASADYFAKQSITWLEKTGRKIWP